MSHAAKMSMKAFWEAVERRLAACSLDDLCAILRAMARETPPRERRAFLEKLARVEDLRDVAQQALQQEELLADIEDLAQELEAAIETAEDWEERYSGYEYDDEDSLAQYEKFVEPLSALFDRAEAAFEYGHPGLARAAYRELFAVLGQEDDYGRGIELYNLDDVDAGETCARYLRALYESEPLESRPRALYAQMQWVRGGLMQPHLALDDLLQISPRPLPDQDRFLADWIVFLRTQEERDADALLREAVRLSQGTPGLEALARREGQRRPLAYLDWCAALEEEDKPQEVLLAAQEALRDLPANLSVRADIADHLCVAAARLNETQVLRAGRWEAFRAQRKLSRLLDLRDTGTERQERTALMQQVALQGNVEDGERTSRIQRPVLAHAYLLAGEFEAACQLVQDQMVLGWSSQSSAQGMVVAFLLVLLSQSTLDLLSPNLAQVWCWGLEYSAGSWFGTGENPLKVRLQDAYAELFSHTPASDDRPESLLLWCLSVVHRRVDAIVGGQKRGAYDKAAVLTVACAETLRLRGDPAAADALIKEIRGRFPRHSAFQRQFRGAF